MNQLEFRGGVSSQKKIPVSGVWLFSGKHNMCTVHKSYDEKLEV